jgi:transcriptional regulator with XRE-family HTH domain
MSNTNKPNPVDVHVGRRVRFRRVMLGLSQQSLGDQLGVTFQQLQKYEKGANRISASRLYDIASILSVPVAFFFDDMPGQKPGRVPHPEGSIAVVNFVSSSEGMRLNRAFAQIADAKVRRRILDLIRALGGQVGESHFAPSSEPIRGRGRKAL